jgi:uncharacterized repeat protein (TIGR02543 family)
MVLFSVLLWTSCTKNPDGTITVTTKTVTDITESSAKTGGSVTSSGYSIGNCGVCYGESHNPTLNNSFTKDHEGDGSFSSILSNLKSGTQYYVRAYAKTSSGIEYGDEMSFATKGGYTINVFANPTASGTVTGAGSYQPEESCTVTATANTGYTFTNWTENGTIFSSNESYNFTVAGSRNLTANFSLKSYSIAVSVAPDNSGTVSGGGEYNHGQSCTLRATANSGFSFTNWTENGEVVSSNANYTFTVDGNRTFVANFEVRNYTISVSTDPSVGGVVSGGGSNFQYSQSCTVTATANSGYAFTNWTENGNVVSTNSNYTFTVTNDRTLVANFEGAYNGHGYVDLGLPSGTLWATCNVGATTPESNGDKFAWGEVQPKSSYEWSNYRYCHGGDGVHTLTKYCNDSEYGYNGFTDNLTILLPSDDAATVNWGTGWSTPGSNQWYELFQNTTMDWTSQNGVYGLLLTASNGKTLFFPQSGYWMNCLTTYAPPPAAILFSINSNDFMDHLTDRCYGLYVRPVHQN